MIRLLPSDDLCRLTIGSQIPVFIARELRTESTVLTAGCRAFDGAAVTLSVTYSRLTPGETGTGACGNGKAACAAMGATRTLFANGSGHGCRGERPADLPPDLRIWILCATVLTKNSADLRRSGAVSPTDTGKEDSLAETEGFEPSVRVIPVRRFSKPLVSATHPRLRMRQVDRTDRAGSGQRRTRGEHRFRRRRRCVLRCRIA